jgi:hypothetical protein
MTIPSNRWLRWSIIAAIVIIALLGLVWTAWFWWRWLSLPWNSQMVIAISMPALVLGWAIWWLWWRLPKQQVAGLPEILDTKARADVEDNFRKTISQALGGAAVLLGAAFAYLQFTKQQQSNHELLISNQVSKAFEQLGSDKLPTRLGGIYALEGV